MSLLENINLNTWFSERELKLPPAHFVISKTALTTESHYWIVNTLSGRYSIVMSNVSSLSFATELYPAFEDPKEAVFYELAWS